MFSTTNYWMNGNDLISPYNKNDTIYYDTSSQNWFLKFKNRSDDSIAYPYVYDSNSTIYQYISGDGGYVDRLKEMGAPSTITGRLLTYEEANNSKDIGKVIVDEYNYSSIIFNVQSSWLGSACTDRHIYVAMYHQGIASETFEADYVGGVRPVIEIPTSEIS